jgi:transcriptional regulator with XRE-family HTH domain
MTRDEITMTVAKNIEALMERKRLSAPEVARRARINATGVYDILSGKSRSPRIETLGKIASALDVPVALLFERQEDADLRREIVMIFARLPEVEKSRLLKTARAWLDDDPSFAP